MKSNPMLWNVLAGVMLVLSACACLMTAVLFINPTVGLNPFPPRVATSPGAAAPAASLTPAGPSPTSAIPTFPPEWTKTFTPSPSDTPTQTATPTHTATATETAPATETAEGPLAPTAAAATNTPRPAQPTNTRPAGGYPGGGGSATDTPQPPTATTAPSYP